MSLLTICQNAANLLSIPAPESVVGSTDQQTILLYALAKRAGRDVADSYDWQVLTEQHTFTTTATAEQTGAVPDDLDHFVSDSFFDRTTRRQLIGPITPQAWQAIQAQPALNRVFLAWRQRSGEFLITPTPSAGDEIAYSYVSKNWVRAANGDLKDSFTADTDEALVSEDLIERGVIWMFRKSKGLDYAEDFRDYQITLQQVQARDQGPGKLNSTGFNYYGVGRNVPEGDFPGP